MAINKNSNVYTIIYTVVMVVIVASLLAFLATSLKDEQDANILNDQKFSIMKAFGAATDESDKVETIENFDSNVTIGVLKAVVETQMVDDEEVAVVVDTPATWLDPNAETFAEESADIFTTLGDRKKLAELTDNLPIFKYEKAAEGENPAETLYVLPMTGTGLWGDIWGYVAVKANAENKLEISGIVMAHAGETPGLGAEIATQKVQDKFAGKLLYEEVVDEATGKVSNVFAVEMVKGLTTAEAEATASKVDAITGGTKTCDGVNLMLANSIGKYEMFLNSLVASTSEDISEEDALAEEAENLENVEPETSENVESIKVEE